MPRFQTYHKSVENQQKSSPEQIDETITLPSSPENFRFFSFKKLFDDVQEEIIKSKNQEELNENQPYPSYKSFTDIMANEIKALIKKEKQLQQVEGKDYEDLIQRFYLILDSYFQSVFSLSFSNNSLSTIFGREKMTFGSSKIEKTLEVTDSLSTFEKTVFLKQIFRSQGLVKLLEIIGRELPHEVNFEFVYVANLVLRDKERWREGEEVQDYFYDPKIKYINFRVANTEVSNQQLKTFFLAFVRQFSNLILQLSQQTHEKGDFLVRQNSSNIPSLKRIKLYSSKSDFFRSDDENEGEISFAPNKKKHL